MPLPTDAKERKATPIYSGVLKYFPLAVAEVARVSKAGNEQHNPGQPLHWDKSKSTDHADCILRHMLQAGELDTDGQRHSAKVAWRALAQLEMELEAQQAAQPTCSDCGASGVPHHCLRNTSHAPYCAIAQGHACTCLGALRRDHGTY